ncbi:MAG: heavy-metal-associated domain-containing protein [Crocinitomicaceae bacterium]|nr:heavy-metal-associated domain-containing protein [Crocinitomicaceae bacterium]
MKVVSFFILIAGLAVLLACSENAANSQDTTTQEEVVASHQAVLGVEGMVCEMGCAASIKKGLNGTQGVANVKVEFEEDRDQNNVFVEFDEKIISIDEIVKTIQALNDGQFSAIQIESKSIQPKVSKIQIKESENSASQKKQQEVNEGYFQFPNLVDLLKGLVY